tara:strand:- start:1203 stop:1448 length:246 start_codon:yes stop_codon:yes gene_type:complete
MKIFLLLSILFITVFFVGKRFFNSAKRNLFKDQSAWSGKDIKIKYTKSSGIGEPNTNDNILKMIANESKVYLDDQSKRKEE